MHRINAKRIQMALVAAGSLWLLFVFQRPLLSLLGQKWNLEHLGQWGDTFGALNALFGGLGFAAVLYTLWQQGEALQSQQDSLKSQQEDLTEQRHDQHRQQFDTAFFQMLDLLRSTRDDLQDRQSGHSYKGVSAFKYFSSTCEYHINNIYNTKPNYTKEDIAKIYEHSVHSVYVEFLGPYFRIMFTILRRIHSDNILSEDDKIKYSNLLRAQLSLGETGLLCMNGTMEEAGTLHEFITEYRMLRYLPDGVLRDAASRIYGADSIEPRND